MKKLYLLLMAVLFGLSATKADNHILTVGGFVFEHENTNPVPGYPVTIEIPPSEIFDGYFNEVMTNDSGYYFDEIALPEAVIQGIVTLSTPGCNGGIISESFDFAPEVMTIIHNFVLCDDPFGDCQALFEVAYLEQNTVQFFNASNPPDAVCYWDFGDGTTSSDPNPVHQFAEAGTYSVCLTITSEELNCEDTGCLEIFTGNINNCEAFFEWLPAPDNPQSIMFINLSTGGDNLTCLWEFGDGSTSAEFNPVHEYAEAGVYPVCLTISSGDDCQNTFCTEVMAENGGGGNCQAYYTWWPSEDPHTIMFMDLSAPAPNAWHWDFGDGAMSEEPNPVHSYEQAGNYPVCLTVTSENCQQTYCENVVVDNGGSNTCTADFSWFPLENLQVQFENLSVPQEAEFMWEFGDGITANEPNPLHQYAESGIYPVCLTISNAAMNCEDTRCYEVQVGENIPCQAYFEWEPLPENPLGIQFFDESTHPDNMSYAWNFGDGTASEEPNPQHIYASPGIYEVCLTISGDGGCEDTFCTEVPVDAGPGGCHAEFTFELLEGFAVQFNDLSSPAIGDWFWDFGDGTTSDEPNPLHVYEGPATYNACLTISSGDSCQDLTCHEISWETPPGNLNASFEYMQDSTNFMTVWFFDTSTGNPVEWLWDFGDGTTSTGQNPVHTYQDQGDYQICLTVSNNINDPSTHCIGIMLDGSYFTRIGDQPSKPDEISIYPNPADNAVVICGRQISHIELINREGRSVIRKNTSGKTQNLNVGQLPAGLYFVKVVDNGKVAVKKLVIW